MRAPLSVGAHYKLKRAYYVRECVCVRGRGRNVYKSPQHCKGVGYDNLWIVVVRHTHSCFIHSMDKKYMHTLDAALFQLYIYSIYIHFIIAPQETSPWAQVQIPQLAAKQLTQLSYSRVQYMEALPSLYVDDTGILKQLTQIQTYIHNAFTSHRQSK